MSPGAKEYSVLLIGLMKRAANTETGYKYVKKRGYVKRLHEAHAIAVRWACSPARVHHLKKATAAVCELRRRRLQK